MITIRDCHSVINGSDVTHELPSGGLDIIAENGRDTLWTVHLNKDGSLEVRAGSVCKINNVIHNNTILIYPTACNTIKLIRPPYPMS